MSPLVASFKSARGYGLTLLQDSLVGSFDAIATAIVPSAGADYVVFSSIPQGYRHLQLRYIARTTRAETNDGFSVQVNGDSGTNYRYHYLATGGSGTPSTYSEGSMAGFTVPYVSAASAASNMYGVGVMDILDYTNTSKNKVARIIGGEDQNGAGWAASNSGLWLSTSAITSIKIQTNGLGDFVEKTHFALYGVK